MPKHISRSVLKKWDTAEDLADAVLEWIVELGQEGILHHKIRPSITAHGLMTQRIVVRNANGNDVPFPIEILVEATFDTDIESRSP